MTIPDDFSCVADALDWKPGDPAPTEALERIRKEFDALRTQLLQLELSTASATSVRGIPPYDQGFRDALLTVKARLTAILSDSTDTQPLAHLEKNLSTLIDRANLDLWKLFAVAEADLSAHPEAEALRAMLRAPTGVLIDSAGRMLFVRLNGTEYDTGVLALLDEITRLKATAEAKPATDYSPLPALLQDALKQAVHLTKAGLEHMAYARADHCRGQITEALSLTESLLEEVARLKNARMLAPAPPELMTIYINKVQFRVERGKPLTFETLLDLAGFSATAIHYKGQGRLGVFEGTLTAGGSLVVPPDTVFSIGRPPIS
jgi:hypothetical protein